MASSKPSQPPGARRPGRALINGARRAILRQMGADRADIGAQIEDPADAGDDRGQGAHAGKRIVAARSFCAGSWRISNVPNCPSSSMLRA